MLVLSSTATVPEQARLLTYPLHCCRIYSNTFPGWPHNYMRCDHGHSRPNRIRIHNMITHPAGTVQDGETTWSLHSRPFSMWIPNTAMTNTPGSLRASNGRLPPSGNRSMGICHLIPDSTCALRYRHPAQGHLAQHSLPNRN